MKKIQCLVLALLMLFTLAACTSTPAGSGDTTASTTAATDSSATSNTETTIPDSDPGAPLQLPITAVSMPVITEQTTAEDGTVLFTHIYQDVALIAPDAETADKIVLNLLKKIDESASTAQNIRQMAIDDYDPDQTANAFLYKLLYNPKRIDEKVLSLYGSEITYSGGVHPVHVCLSVTYDMATGKELKLQDILVDDSTFDALSQLIIQDLDAHKKEYQLFDGYASVVAQRYGTASANTDNEAWYFSDTGLCVFFSPYDIAPYVAGQILVEIPYDQLNGIVRDDYLVPELPAAEGQIHVALAQDVDLDRFTQFAETTLDTSGERFVLYCDGLVTNVRLVEGSWAPDGSQFFGETTVFLSHTLCPGDAIMVQAAFMDAMPTLQLCYESNGSTYVFFLTQSGEDGSVFLCESGF